MKYVNRKKYLYLLLVPVLAYYAVFHYAPMYGIVMAFQNYNMFQGVFGSEWVGLSVIEEVIHSNGFWLSVRNTLFLNLTSLIIVFPAPIILAILLNEVIRERWKRVIQSAVYLPHFISWIVLSGILILMLSEKGMINQFLGIFGIPATSYLSHSSSWIVVYVLSDIWKEIGWSSIIYLAAIASLDPSIYEAAKVDGASKWKQVWHITLPGIKPTIILLLILNIGQMVSIGFEKPFMLGNAMVSNVADVISTHVYTNGVTNTRYSYSTAVGMFQSVINLILIVSANQLSKKLTKESIW
ncbi:ABC transporter permease [Paenibacillus swuensis]|nr:ABC transporter permease subunit [Paenibacillus swuensis]